MQYIWVMTTFALTVIAVVIYWQLATTQSVGERLERLTQLQPPPQTLSTPNHTLNKDSIPALTRLIKNYRLTESLYVELSSAGLPIRPSEFVGVIAGSVVFSQILALLVLHSLSGQVLLGILGIAAPILALRYLQGRRRAAFNDQIGDALVMIASSLRSGFSLLRAIQVVAHELPPPISEEFQRVVSEASAGRSMEDALTGIVGRVKSYDFDLAVTAMLIHLQVGGNLSDILEIIAATIRERVRIVGEMKALTAEGKLSGVILVLLPAFLGIVLSFLNPKYMSILIGEPIGHFLITAAVVLQITGGLVINRMLALDI